MGDVEFAILGAGAIGSIIGAHLARSGRTVVMLARGRRAEDMERLEIEETLGYAVRSAAQLNLPLPLLECFYRLVRGIDRIRR